MEAKLLQLLFLIRYSHDYLTRMEIENIDRGDNHTKDNVKELIKLDMVKSFTNKEGEWLSLTFEGQRLTNRIENLIELT